MTNFRSSFHAGATLFCILLTATINLAQQPDSLPPLDSLSEPALFDLALDLSDKALALEKAAQPRMDALVRSRKEIENQLGLAKQDSAVSKTVLNRLKSDLKRAKKAEKSGKKYLEEASRAAALSLAALEMSPEAQRRQLPLVHQAMIKAAALLPADKTEEEPIAAVLGPVQVGAPDDAASSEAPPEAESDSTAAQARPTPSDLRPAVQKTAVYDPAQDVMLQPPTPPCRMAVERRDAFSGALYRETTATELFRFTNPVMKKVLGEEPHIDCQAVLSAAEGNINLHLNFIVNDPNARKSFGGLNRGAIVMLRFMDGSTYTLNNNRADEGSADPLGKRFFFHGQYSLDRTVQKMISRSELDKLRIAWATGYEDYDIYQVDALMNLYRCLTTSKP